MEPAEPAPTTLVFPPASSADAYGRVAIGGDLEPGSILAAYRAGLFPMPVHGVLIWWSPQPRGVLPLDGLHVSRRLRRTLSRFEIRVDTAFDEVLAGCRARGPARGEWITDDVADAYAALHELGWVHSVEAWTRPSEGGEAALAGGLYGVAIGGLFAGESMFHRERDASKVALAGLVDILRDDGRDGAGRLIDVQWPTDHLVSLGVVPIARRDYLRRLDAALALPLPAAFRSRPSG